MGDHKGRPYEEHRGLPPYGRHLGEEPGCKPRLSIFEFPISSFGYFSILPKNPKVRAQASIAAS